MASLASSAFTDVADGCDVGAFELFPSGFSLSLLESKDPVIAGDEVVHALTLTNLGGSARTALQVQVEILWPLQVTPSSVASTGSVSGGPFVHTWSIPSLAAGASATFAVTFSVADYASTTPDGISTSAAMVAAEGGDPQYPSAAETTTVKSVLVFVYGFENGLVPPWSSAAAGG